MQFQQISRNTSIHCLETEEVIMAILTDRELRTMLFAVLDLERKNARSMEKSDPKMSDEIQKLITDYAKQHVEEQ